MIRGQAEAAPFTYVLFCVIYKGAFDTANPCGLDVRLLFFCACARCRVFKKLIVILVEGNFIPILYSSFVCVYLSLVTRNVYV